ncbi:hypothetical protein [Xanthobacter wiegelii]|uniref:hypothetical protein n=1 Tax=Xanthobacter wiegelii TaxID=3119913 RepID=UPI00372683EA
MANHSAVAHAWAHRTGRQTKGLNVFYDGDTIYSYGYHFAIARHYVDAHGNACVLFNRNGYSVSTAKHKRYVYGACSHLPVYQVDNPRHDPSRTDWEHLVKNAEDAVARAKRARKYGDMHLRDAAHYLEQANAFNEAFALGCPSVSLETLGLVTADIEARLEAERLRQAQEVARREAERHAREEAAREAWLAGTAGVHWYGRSLTGGALLRIEGEELQTSLGASVPLSHAIRVFRFVADCRAKGTDWKPNGKSIHVGHFTVDRVYPNGDFKAGCHLIEWSETERLARQLGLLTPADSINSH